MHLFYNNINDAFHNICRGFHTGVFSTLAGDPSDRNRGHRSNCKPPLSRGPSRYGSVIRVEEPVTITYTKPSKRVLFHPVRDANPFLHLIEALWMLAGQNRVQSLAHFAKRMAEFSDDDLTSGEIPFRGTSHGSTDFTGGYMWGAYGYRWRNWFKWDQLESCIKILRSDKITRRVVLGMWEPRDLQRVEKQPTCKDVPCNLLVMFSPRPSDEVHRLHTGQVQLPSKKRELVAAAHRGELTHMIPDNPSRDPDMDMKGCTLLDMTVVNRSNDTLWGALGSNYVHFSFLQEYVANACGMGVGHYHQMTNNLHIYSDKSEAAKSDRERWSGKWFPEDLTTSTINPYVDGYEHYPLYRCPTNDFEETDIHRRQFDNACLSLFDFNKDFITHPPHMGNNGNSPESEVPFFNDVVLPMLRAWEQHKKKDYAKADFYTNMITPMDWRSNCQQWLKRRATKYTEKVSGV